MCDEPRGKKFKGTLGAQWDQCILHAIQNLGVGLALGLIGSVLIFKRQKWMFQLGLGYGIGSAYSSCEQDLFPSEYLPPCERDKSEKSDKSDKGKEKKPDEAAGGAAKKGKEKKPDEAAGGAAKKGKEKKTDEAEPAKKEEKK